MSVPDTTFCLFFRSHPEAACLACDAVGVSFDEMLYISEDLFVNGGAPTREIGLLQYNLRERQRQELFRKLFTARQEIIAENKVGERWEERQRLFPDAPQPPRIREMIKAAKEMQQQQRRQNGEAGGVEGGVGGGGDDGFDTESEDDELDEMYRPKPPPPPPSHNNNSHHHQHQQQQHSSSTNSHILLGSRNAQQRLNLPPSSASASKRTQQQQPQPQQQRPTSPAQLALAIFPQPPAGPPIVSGGRNAAKVKEETRLVKMSKQRLRHYAQSYVEEERHFVDLYGNNGDDSNINTNNQQLFGDRRQQSISMADSRKGREGAGGGGVRLSFSSSAIGGGASNSGGDGSKPLELPAVPDAGKTNQRQLRNLLAVSLSKAVESAAVQQRFDDEAAAGAAREKKGEFTLNTIRNEYPYTPTPGFGPPLVPMSRANLGKGTSSSLSGDPSAASSSPSTSALLLASSSASSSSAIVSQWSAKRAAISEASALTQQQRYEALEEKMAKQAAAIEKAEAEKLNPHKVLINEAAKIRRLLANERKEGIARAHEQRVILSAHRRQARHEHAGAVQEARRQVATTNRDAHDQLKLFRVALKEEEGAMAVNKQFDVPRLARAVWDSGTDTIVAPTLGIRPPPPPPPSNNANSNSPKSRLNDVIDEAVAAATRRVGGGGSARGSGGGGQRGGGSSSVATAGGGASRTGSTTSVTSRSSHNNNNSSSRKKSGGSSNSNPERDFYDATDEDNSAITKALMMMTTRSQQLPPAPSTPHHARRQSAYANAALAPPSSSLTSAGLTPTSPPLALRQQYQRSDLRLHTPSASTSSRGATAVGSPVAWGDPAVE